MTKSYPYAVPLLKQNLLNDIDLSIRDCLSIVNIENRNTCYQSLEGLYLCIEFPRLYVKVLHLTFISYHIVYFKAINLVSVTVDKKTMSV